MPVSHIVGHPPRAIPSSPLHLNSQPVSQNAHQIQDGVPAICRTGILCLPAGHGLCLPSSKSSFVFKTNPSCAGPLVAYMTGPYFQ